MMAGIHHVAAFTIAVVLALELILLKLDLTADSARTLVRIDAVFGIAALVLLVVGFLRVLYFEKGAAYYFHSAPFLVKLTSFVVIGLLSIYPTLQFLGWRKALASGQTPTVAPAVRRRMRLLVHIELGLLVVIVLCAVMMARGVGYLG
jgi:putative membrane protein